MPEEIIYKQERHGGTEQADMQRIEMLIKNKENSGFPPLRSGLTAHNNI